MAFDLTAVLRLRDNLSNPLRRAAKGVSTMEKAVNATNKKSEKLTKTVTKTTSAFSRVESTGKRAFNRVNSSASTAINTIKRYAVAIGSATVAAKGLEATIGSAARFEQSAVLIEAMFNDKKAAAAYTKMLERMAEDSPVLNFQDMLANSKSFVSLNKNDKVLKRAWSVVEKLNVLDPIQGVEGAVFAMRELASGDAISMIQRFEMPRAEMNKIKKLPFEQQVDALDKLLARMNITDDVVKKMGNTTVAQWNRFKEQMDRVFRNIGTSANSTIGKSLARINNLLESGAFDSFAKMADRALGSVINKIADLVDYAVNNRDKLASMWNDFMAKLEPVKAGFGWLKDNLPTVTNAVISLAAGVGAFKFALSSLLFMDKVIELINAYRKGVFLATIAQRGFNTALWMNPLTWIAAGIAAVVAAGVWLWRNWDTIKEKAAQLATWVTEKWGQLVTGIREKLQQAKDFVVGVFTQFPFIVAEKLGYMLGLAVGWLMRLPETFREWFTQARENAVNTIQSLPEKIASIIQSIPKRIGGAISAVWEAFKNLGASIPKAIAEGFQAALGGLGGLARWAVEKVAGGLSTLRELGASFGRGFARGMDAHGSHRTGLYRVPFDGYIAELHRGERVLTAREAREYDRVMYSAALARSAYVFNNTYNNANTSNNSTNNRTVNNTFNINFTGNVRSDKDIDLIARELAREIREAAGLVNR